MKKLYIMLGAMSLLAGCASDSDRTTKPIDDELQQEFVTSIQEVVQNQEEMGDVTWPEDVEDYHIVDKGDGIYDTSGKFTWQNEEYEFDISFEMNADADEDMYSYQLKDYKVD